MTMTVKFRYLMSIPKSFWVCCKLMSFKQALKLPILVNYNTIIKLKGQNVVVENPTFAGIRFGFPDVGIYGTAMPASVMEISGDVLFKGTANFGANSRITIQKPGKLVVGNNFTSTSGIRLICHDAINIGQNCLIGWNVLITDASFHIVENVVSGECSDFSRPIIIENDVWVGSYCKIMPGTCIRNGSVAACASVLTKQYNTSNILLAGNPAQIKKNNIQRMDPTREPDYITSILQD